MRFDDAKALPGRDVGLLQAGWCKMFVFEALHGSATLRDFDVIPSDGTVFYRVVVGDVKN